MCIVFTGSRDGRKSSEKTVSRYARLVAQPGRKHIDCRRRATTRSRYIWVFFFSRFRAVRSGARWARKRGRGKHSRVAPARRQYDIICSPRAVWYRDKTRAGRNRRNPLKSAPTHFYV